MTHQHESWNVPIKSTAVCLTEFIILPQDEMAKEEDEKEGGNCQTYILTVLPLKLHFTMSRWKCIRYGYNLPMNSHCK